MSKNLTMAICQTLCDLSEDRSSFFYGFSPEVFRTFYDLDPASLIRAVRERLTIPWNCQSDYLLSNRGKRVLLTIKNMLICNAAQIHIPDNTEKAVAAEIANQMLLNIDDIQKIFKCSRTKARNITLIPGFPAIRIDSMTYVQPSELEKWLARYRCRHVFTKIR